MPLWFLALTQFSIIAYALLGGVFLAFSDFLMRALAKTDGAGGVEAMQHINREVFRWVFMTLFIGMAPLSLLLSGYVFWTLDDPGSGLIALAGLVYVFGCFGITVFRNVPLNETLAKMPAQDAATLAFWRETYLPRWTFWNSFRTAACVLAAGLALTGALRLVGSAGA